MGEKAKDEAGLENGDHLAELGERFRRWRTSRSRGERTPPPLWAAAIDIALEHGVPRVANKLLLSADLPHKRMGAPSNTRRPMSVSLSSWSCWRCRPRRQPSRRHRTFTNASSSFTTRGARRCASNQRRRPGRFGSPAPRVLGRDMIEVRPHTRVLLAVEPVNFRADFDGIPPVSQAPGGRSIQWGDVHLRQPPTQGDPRSRL